MKELEAQKIFKAILEEEFKIHKQKVRVLVGKEFKNISTHWAEKPDLIIFHNITFKSPNMKETILKSPIGIEYKNTGKLDDITKGVIKQLQNTYLEKKYLDNTTGKEFTLNSLAFANTKGIMNGIMYTGNFPQASNFFIERFCWKADVAVILREINNGLIFSHHNYYFELNGKPYMEHSRFWLSEKEQEKFRKNQVVM